MRQSRYIWILGITLVCLIGISAWKSPQAVMVALIEPQYADSPKEAVQRFWGYLDSRQLDLVDALILREEMNPAGVQEVQVWKEKVLRNPLINLTKLDFLESSDSLNQKVKVNWSSPLKEEILETYEMKVLKTSEGYKIIDIKSAQPQSLDVN